MPLVEFSDIEGSISAGDVLSEMENILRWFREEGHPAFVLLARCIEDALRAGKTPAAFYYVRIGLVMVGMIEALSDPESVRLLRLSLACAEREVAEEN